MEKESLDDIWKDAARRFNALTNQDIKRSPARSLEDIRKQVDGQQPDSSGQKEKDGKKHAKDMVLNVLSCIKLLGGVAAQGASMAFGPAELCFNAVSLLLDIPSKIHEFHEAVDSLLDEVSVILSQFRIYQRIEQFSSIDPELLMTIQNLMISFVGICALSINLRNSGRWKRFKSSTKKALFDDDSGVKQELDNFKSLVQKQAVIRETLTLENVLRSRKELSQLLFSASESGKRLQDISSGVEILTTAEKNRKLEDITKDQQKKIQKKLLLSNDIVQASKTICNDLWTESVQRTGSWLRDIPEYTSWADAKSNTNPLLLLTGDANSGKSFLVSAMIHELQSKYDHNTKGLERAPLLAYHFFPKHTEKSGHAQRPIETALKCLALQIAEQDTSYAKQMAAYCDLLEDADFKDSSCQDLWDNLKFILPKRDIMYFFILDGLDQLSDDDPAKQQLLGILGTLQRSLTEPDQSQIRVFASAKSTTFGQDAFRSVPSIDIEQHNEAEIRYFIEHQLLRHDLLMGRDSETMEMRSLINDRLPTIAQGNFFKVQTALEKIEAVVAADGSSMELKKILDEAGQDRESIARNVVDALNEQLSTKEIEEVNELLIWVVFAREYFDVDKLKAALYLTFRTTSLQPLDKKLKGKYSKLFEFSGDDGVAILEDVREVVVTPESTRRVEDDAPKISATITITKADIKTVQNFLWNLTEKAMIDKFEFRDATAIVQTKRKILVNEFDAHLTIVKRSFEFLLAEPDEKTIGLGAYILGYLPFHLSFLRNDPAFVDMSITDKREIGRGVFSLLVDGDVLEKYWDRCGYGYVWFFEVDGWSFNDKEGLAPFWDWLEDLDAIRYLGKKDKEWLVQLKLQPSPNFSLLEPISLMVARRWLIDREWGAGGLFDWINKFLSIKGALESNEVASGAHVEDVDQHIEKNETNNDVDQKGEGENTEDSDNTREAGDTEDEEDPDKNSENSEEAEEDSSYGSSISLAEAVAVAAAASWVQSALKVQEPNSLWYERLGETYTLIIEYESAIEAYKQAIALDSPSWKCFRGLAMAYASDGEIESAVSAMEKTLEMLRMADVPTEEVHTSILTDLVCIADWEVELQRWDAAINYYEETLLIDPSSSEAQAKLLKLLLTRGQDKRACELLSSMNSTKAKNADLSQLAATLPVLLLEHNSDAIFSMLFAVTQKTPIFTSLLQDMDGAIDFARNEDRDYDYASLLLHKGIALYRYDEREERSPELALSVWEQAGASTSKEEPWRLTPVIARAFRLLSSYHFEHARASPNPAYHIEKMEQYSAKRFGTGATDSHARSYLGCYYALAGDRATAKKVFLGDIKAALALLSDDVEENDYQGFYQLADILMHAGDSMNALSAWSLLGPTDGSIEVPPLDEDLTSEGGPPPAIVNGDAEEEVLGDGEGRADTKEDDTHNEGNETSEEEEPEEEGEEEGEQKGEDNSIPPAHDDRAGDLSNFCDGRCGILWHYADDFYCCKICPDVQFCIDCLGKLKAGTLQRYICKSGHDWLRVPKWNDDEFKEVREKRVKIGGELKGDTRVGFKTVAVEDWLNILRDDWGIPRAGSKELITEDVAKSSVA